LRRMVEEHRVELIDYLDVFWRWKWLIVLGALGCALVTGLITWQMPGTYRIKSIIDTGDLGEARDKDVERLVTRLKARGAVRGVKAPSGLTAQFTKPSLIELGIETQSPGEAVKDLERTSAGVIDDLNTLLKAQREEIEANIRAVRARIDQTEGEMRLRERRVADLRRSLERLHQARTAALRRTEDPAGVLVFVRLSDEITEKEAALVELERQVTIVGPAQRRELEVQAKALAEKTAALRPAQVLAAPDIPRVPIRPRLKLNVAVSLVAGVFGSVALAFFLEYLRQARERLANVGRP
jgi:hypothetical protein